MFPLSNMMSSFVKTGTLNIIDADGKRHVFSGAPGPQVTVRIHDKSLYWALVLNPELRAGEGYMDGQITLEDGSTLKDMLQLYNLNRRELRAYPLQALLGRISMSFRRLQQSNRLGGGARANVAHHYDVGNDFYKLFLDENLLYSCAYFRSDDDTLEQAQRNKLRLLAAKMNLKPGMKVLDIGCGWGDTAMYLAKLAEVEVTGVTLSTEQQELATERARKAGLANQVQFRLQDYRNVEEKFDRIISIGMFEHVGAHHYDEFFKKLNDLMPDDGVAVLHSIGHMDPPTTASPWFRKYIFPGGYAPALSEVLEVTERNDLWVLDLEFLRLHYAKTLEHWHDRFQKNRAKVVEMYDDRFARMWEFYLVAAESMFRFGAQLVFQMQMSRSRDAVPITRDYTVDTQRAYEKLESELKMAV